MAFTGEPCAVAVRAKGVAGTEGESLMLLTCGQMDAGESAAALNCVMKNIAISADEQDRLGGQVVVSACPSLRVIYRAVGQLYIATVHPADSNVFAAAEALETASRIVHLICTRSGDKPKPVRFKAKYAEIYLSLLDAFSGALPAPAPNSVAPRSATAPLATLVKLAQGQPRAAPPARAQAQAPAQAQPPQPPPVAVRRMSLESPLPALASEPADSPGSPAYRPPPPPQPQAQPQPTSPFSAAFGQPAAGAADAAAGASAGASAALFDPFAERPEASGGAQSGWDAAPSAASGLDMFDMFGGAAPAPPPPPQEPPQPPQQQWQQPPPPVPPPAGQTAAAWDGGLDMFDVFSGAGAAAPAAAAAAVAVAAAPAAPAAPATPPPPPVPPKPRSSPEKESGHAQRPAADPFVDPFADPFASAPPAAARPLASNNPFGAPAAAAASGAISDPFGGDPFGAPALAPVPAPPPPAAIPQQQPLPPPPPAAATAEPFDPFGTGPAAAATEPFDPFGMGPQPPPTQEPRTSQGNNPFGAPPPWQAPALAQPPAPPPPAQLDFSALTAASAPPPLPAQPLPPLPLPLSQQPPHQPLGAASLFPAAQLAGAFGSPRSAVSSAVASRHGGILALRVQGPVGCALQGRELLQYEVCGSTLTSCGLRGVLLLSEPPAQSPAGPSQQGDGGAEVTVGGARGALSGLWAGPACRGDVAAGFDGCFAVSSLGAAARAGAVAAYGLSPYAAAAAAPLHCASFVSGTWGGPTAVSIRVVCPAGVEGGVGEVAISLCHCRAPPTKTSPPCFWDPQKGELFWKVQGLPPSGRARLQAAFPPGALDLAGGQAVVRVLCIRDFRVAVTAEHAVGQQPPPLGLQQQPLF